MSIPNPPPVRALPPTPSRANAADGDEFSALMDNHLATLPLWSGDLDDLAQWTFERATDISQAVNQAQGVLSDVQTVGDQKIQAASAQADRAQDEADRAESIASGVGATTNFGGVWTALVGAVTVPLSVYHQGSYWQLLTDLADVASVEPGTDSGVWLPLAQSSIDIGGITYSFADLTQTGLFVEPGMTYLQSAYPDLFGVVGIGEAPPSVFDYATLPATGSPEAMDSNGDVIAVFQGDSPKARLLKRNALTGVLEDFQTLSGADLLNNGAVAFTPDGAYLAVVGNVASPAPRTDVLIYKKDGSGAYNLLAGAVPSGPGRTAQVVAWSRDGQYLSVGGQQAPDLFVWERSGDVFSPVSDAPTGMPGGDVYGLAWVSNDIFVASINASPWLRAYKVSGGALAVHETLSGGPPTVVRPLVVSPDGTLMVSGAAFNDQSDGGLYVWSYQPTTESFSFIAKRSGVSRLVVAIAFSADGKYLAAVHRQSPTSFPQKIAVKLVDGGALTHVLYAEPGTATATRGVAFLDNSTLAVSNGDAGGSVNVYTGDFPFDTSIEFYLPAVAPLTPGSVGDWVPTVQGRPYVRAK